MSLTPPSSFPSFCPLIFPLFFFVSFHSYLFLVFPYVRYLHIQMTTTDDRDRDGNISNGSTHIMISRHSAFGSFSLIRKSVTAMLWPLWLFSVTCWLPFRHEDFFFFFLKNWKKKKRCTYFLPLSSQLCSSWRHLTKWKQNCYHDFVNRWVIKFFLFFVFIVRLDAAEWECYWDAWPGCWATFSPLYFFVICW